jgi:hypothetical protein
VRSLFNATVKPIYVAARSAGIGLLERRAHIKTTGHLTPEQLGFSPEHRVRYEPAQWFALARILPRREVSSADVLVDFGSGMGRVVYQAASRYRLARVEGVELSAELTAVAIDNIKRNRGRMRCEDIRLVTADALEYKIPDDITIAFFANPFTGPIFQSVVDRLVASVERHPRRLRVIYLNPVEEQMLLDAGFRVVRRLRGLRPGRQWARSNSTVMYQLGG